MRRAAIVAAAGMLLWANGTVELSAYPLSLEQRQRFERYLPRTFPKLEARDPVHVVLLGDSVTGGYTPVPDAWESLNPLFSYAGIFLDEIAREFFYPGGVRLINPPTGGTAKLSPYLGDEITLENLTDIDGTALDGLRRAAGDAFVHEPDLVVVQYGIYDAFGEICLDVYRRALQGIIDEARRHQADVILLGPGMVRHGFGPLDWGATRPYASTAREVARANGAFFLDAGQHLSRFGGGVDPKTEASAAMDLIGARLGRMFHYGPDLDGMERVHPSRRANEYLGERLFDELKHGPPKSDFTYAGVANFTPEGIVEVVLMVHNQSEEIKQGTVGALSVSGCLVPLPEAARRFSVPPQASTQIAFRYRRPIVGKARDGSDVLFPLEATDEFARFSFLLEDGVGSELIDLPLRIGPVAAVWRTRHVLGVTDRLRVEWDLVNGSDRSVSGTFQVGMGDQIGNPTPFTVPPLGTSTVFSEFDFRPPDGEAAFQREIWIQTETDGTRSRFYRELEASRDLVLGEEIDLRSWDGYVNAPPAGDPAARTRGEGEASVYFEADEEALYAVATLRGAEIPDHGEQASLRGRLFLDARPEGEVRTFGAVRPIEVYATASGGAGLTPAIPQGALGHGCRFDLPPRGIVSVLSRDQRGDAVLQIRVPRAFLHRHDWDLGSPHSVLGARFELSVADARIDAEDPFPAAKSFVSNSPTFAFEDRVIRSFDERDARSLTTLRLSRQPVRSWTVRIY